MNVWARRRLLSLVAVASAIVLAPATLGQSAEFPGGRPITLQVPFSAGGPSDTEARIVAKYAEKALGTSIVIENVAGAGGVVAWNRVPDFRKNGYEITIYNLPHIVSNPLVRETKFDRKSFDWIAHIGRDPNSVIVGKDSPFKDLNDLIEAARKDPGKVTVGMAGKWLAHHFTAMYLQNEAGVKFTELPFPGTAPALTALIGGHIDVVISNVSDTVRPGPVVRSIGVAAEERSPFLPDVPTFREQGYDFVISSDRGVAAPVGTDKRALETLRQAFGTALRRNDLRKEFEEKGANLHVLTDPADIEAYVDEVEQLITRLLKALDIEIKKQERG